MAAVVELAALFFLFFEGKKTPAFFVFKAGVVVCCGCVDFQASMLAYVAFCSMNCRLGPTSSPMSMENT